MPKLSSWNRDFPPNKWGYVLSSGALKKAWKKTAPVRYYCNRGCLLGFVYPVDVLQAWDSRDGLEVGHLNEAGRIQVKRKAGATFDIYARYLPWSPESLDTSSSEVLWLFSYMDYAPEFIHSERPGDVESIAFVRARSIREARKANFEEALRQGEDVRSLKDVGKMGVRNTWEVYDIPAWADIEKNEKLNHLRFVRLNDNSRFGYMCCKHIEVEREASQVLADVERMAGVGKNGRQVTLEGHAI